MKQNSDKNIREQQNNNRDRPPVTPETPDGADPFDPFETAHLSDGGAVIQDTKEQTFQNGLEKLQPSGTDTTAQPTIQNEASRTITLQSGTLLAEISEFTTDLSRESCTYRISQKDQLTHQIKTPTKQITLQETEYNTFTVSFTSETEDGVRNETEREYRSFATAFASCIEGVDWGSLPAKNSDPTIWSYDGYSNITETFIDYISGASHEECGTHVIRNADADYEIMIESYENKTCADLETICIVTFSRLDSEVLLYRRRFTGQKQAFEFVVAALESNVSHTIALHEGKHGESEKLPTVDELISRY